MFSQVGWFFTGALALASTTFADPQYFRSNNGVAAEAGSVPADFNSPKTPVWRTPVDSGHSSPIFSNGKIFLTTSNPGKHELATIALDAQSGTVLWKAVVPAVKIEDFHPQEGNAAMATPACEGDRVVVFFGSHGLICYSTEGTQIWDHPMGPFRDEYGAASSPIIFQNRVILNEDHDVDSFIVALDLVTGRELWRTPRPDAVRSYATPAVWEQDGNAQILVGGSLELSSYNPQTGEKLWWVNGLARIVIPTPFPAGDWVYMASWAPGGDSGRRISLQSWTQALQGWDQDKDGRLAQKEVQDGEVLSRFFRMDLNQDHLLDEAEWEHHAAVFRRAENAVLALRPKGRGDLTKSALVWKYMRGIPYVASPVLHKGVLWMVKDGGLVTKLAADTGEVLQQERLGVSGNYYSSPVAADGKVFFASESGVVTTVADEKDWRIISSHKFGEKIHATPLVVKQRIYIRTEKALYCFDQESALR